jgi:hypothetical protein
MQILIAPFHFGVLQPKGVKLRAMLNMGWHSYILSEQQRRVALPG